MKVAIVKGSKRQKKTSGNGSYLESGMEMEMEGGRLVSTEC